MTNGLSPRPSLESASRWWQGLRFDHEDLGLLELAGQLNRDHLRDAAARIDGLDRTGEAYRAEVEAWMTLLAESGLWSLAVPEAFGGVGFSLTRTCLVLEELATVFPSAANGVLSNMCATSVLGGCADRPVAREWLARLAAESARGGFALTEPGAGSDIRGISTSARADGDDIRVTGEKCFITNAGFVHFFCVFARKDDGPETTVVLVPADAKGVEIPRLLPTMGLRGSPTGIVHFNDVRVPADLVLYEANGLHAALETLTWTRVAVAAISAGIARGSFDYAARYVQERTTFGKPVIQHAVVRHQLAQVWSDIEAVRSLMYRTAACFDNGETIARLGAAAKVNASDIAFETASLAVQLLGGHGYTSEHPVERLLRDAKVMQILDGANDVLLAYTIPNSLFG